MGSLNKPDEAPPSQASDLPPLKELINSLLLIRPYDYKRNEDGSLDQGKFEKPTVTHVAEVYVLDGRHEDVHYTSLFLSGARLNPQLKPFNEADTGKAGEWTVGRLELDDKARILAKPSAKEWKKAEAKLEEISENQDGADEPPY